MTFDRMNLDQRLAAFADGELDPACRVAVLEYLAEHPDAMRKLVAEHKLRSACGRVIASSCGGCCAEVKRRVAELARDTPITTDFTGGASPGDQDVLRPATGWSRWTPLAAAAVFFIAAIIALSIGNRRDSLGDGSIIPVSQVEMFQWRHTRCSRAVDALETGSYPQQIDALPAAIAASLGEQPYPVLDLSAAGYAFERAGPCNIPGEQAIHLIYKARPDTGRDDRLSLWIEPDNGHLRLEPGKAYHITGDTAAHPILVWKHGDMIYYLVGDDDTAVNTAVTTLNQGA